MTNEREKFLASISKEERVIRQYILAYEKKIKIFKHYMNDDEEDTDYIRDARCEIAKRKIIIKSLKKQLPAPRIKLELTNGVVFPSTCSICKYPFTEANYCAVCGRKLR